MADKLQEQVDYMVLRFQDTMKKFDDLSDKSDNFFVYLKDMALKVECLSKDHGVISEFVKNNANTNDKTTKEILGSVGNIFHILDKSANQFQLFEKQFGQFNGQISDVYAQISGILEKNKGFATKNEVDAMNIRLSGFNSDVRSALQSQAEKNIEHSNRINSLNSFTSSLDKELSDHKNFTTKIGQSLDNLISIHTVHQLAVESKIKTLGNEFTAYVDKQIAAIPKPVIPSMDEAKEHVNIKVEPALLDARNANIRSTNNEQKIFIMEKKIEQLQLLLNKLQIQA